MATEQHASHTGGAPGLEIGCTPALALARSPPPPPPPPLHHAGAAHPVRAAHASYRRPHTPAAVPQTLCCRSLRAVLIAAQHSRMLLQAAPASFLAERPRRRRLRGSSDPRDLRAVLCAALASAALPGALLPAHRCKRQSTTASLQWPQAFGCRINSCYD